ncbi:MAG: Gmad2 immunoglobulin-like domain-containing protein [Candidatus Komeilibacteria bacterium]|nr:Gmad2 immunoglobulin-like domain-containing protein [Candidatus Komeilibacteria bacterium]
MPKKVIIPIVLILIVVLGFIFWPKVFKPQNSPVACTMEAKLCPDGSSVGRSGPNCEFAPCPQVAADNNQDSWKTFSDPALGVSFKYPDKLSADYITPADWPPVIKVSPGQFSCVPQSGTPSLPDRKVKTINNQIYCLETMSEGAAGSVYTTYTYTTAKNSQLVSLTFTLRYPQCLNYDNPKQSDCLAERQAFDLDGLVNGMVLSAGFSKADLIQVSYPVPNQIVASPLTITGQARGMWFFEASFPIELTDANGQTVASGLAQATSDWMTENFVPFTATLKFTKPQTSTGVLILKKDNPSGLPEHDDSLQIPVVLKSSS